MSWQKENVFPEEIKTKRKVLLPVSIILGSFTISAALIVLALFNRYYIDPSASVRIDRFTGEIVSVSNIVNYPSDDNNSKNQHQAFATQSPNPEMTFTERLDKGKMREQLLSDVSKISVKINETHKLTETEKDIRGIFNRNKEYVANVEVKNNSDIYRVLTISIIGYDTNGNPIMIDTGNTGIISSGSSKSTIVYLSKDCPKYTCLIKPADNEVDMLTEYGFLPDAK